MKRVRNAAVTLFVLLAAACSSGFSTGPQIPGVGQSPGANPYGQPSPQSSATAAPSTAPKGTASDTQTFSVADVAKGIPCPESGGFTCVLRFNLPVPAPSPSGSAKASASESPSPSPTPSPTPTPSPAPEGKGTAPTTASATPSPGPSGATLALAMTVLPTDAPKMVITTKNALPTTALMRISLVPSDDFILDGPASAVFTLPKDQLANRGFAIQLFEDSVNKKGKHDFRPLFTLAKSTLQKQQLTFNFTPPKLTLPKHHHYLIVLYGDERTSTASPAASAESSPTTSPSGAASVSPSPAATGSPI